MPLHKIGGERRQPVVLTQGPAIFDGDVLAFDKSRVSKALLERGNHMTGIGRRAATHEANDGWGRLRLSKASPQTQCAKKYNE